MSDVAKTKNMYLIRLPQEIRRALEEKKAKTKIPLNTLILNAVKTAIDNNWGCKR